MANEKKHCAGPGILIIEQPGVDPATIERIKERLRGLANSHTVIVLPPDAVELVREHSALGLPLPEIKPGDLLDPANTPLPVENLQQMIDAFKKKP